MKKALIIEDDNENCRILALILRKAGYVVEETDNAEAGLRRVVTFKPDLILMDINLPGINGLDAAHILKEDVNSQDIKVFAMSVYNEEMIRNIFPIAGCDGYLEKPIYYRTFMEKLKTIA